MKNIMTTILLFSLIMLGACSDVEEEGIPLPAKFRVESDEYQIQITNENIDGVAFVYRWINIENAKYMISLSSAVTDEVQTQEDTPENPEEGTEEPEIKTVTVEDTSILTYNNVRELQFTNKQILEYAKALDIVPQPGVDSATDFILNFSAVDESGNVIKQDEVEATATASIRVVFSRDLKLDDLTDKTE